MAELAKGRLRPKVGKLKEALDGHFGPHHAVVVRCILDHLDQIDAAIATLSERIVSHCQDLETQIEVLCEVPGLARTAAETVLAET